MNRLFFALLFSLSLFLSASAQTEEQGLAKGVSGSNTYAKALVIEQINAYPHHFLSLMNNASFEIRVHQLDLVDIEEGKKMLVDPATGETAAVLTKPIFNRQGAIIGAEMFLPPEGVIFKAANGQVVPVEAMAAHETRHAHQMANGDFGMHSDLPDMIAAENDAQKIENKISGNTLEYFGNKREPGSMFYYGDIPVIQGNQNYKAD